MKIEKGVKVPNRHDGPGRIPIYPFAQMESGDSFYVDADKYPSASASAYCYARRHNLKVVIRKEGSGGRIWIFDKE